MSVRAALFGFTLAACQAKKQEPPPAAPPPPDADACKRAAQDAIMQSDRAISNALAAAKLELFAPQFLSTPFDAPPGMMRDPVAARRFDEELAPFAGKHTGDTVTLKHGADTVAGIFVEPAKEGWLIARRGAQIVLVKPARWREVTCVDPRNTDGNCIPGGGPRRLLFALPPGTTFGGTFELDAERVTLRLTGGPPALCPK